MYIFWTYSRVCFHSFHQTFTLHFCRRIAESAKHASVQSQIEVNLFICTVGLTSRVENRVKEKQKRETRWRNTISAAKRHDNEKKHMDAQSMVYVQNKITQ